MKLTFVLFLAGLHLCFGIPTNGTSIATFLQQTKPIQVSFCKGLGYNTTSKINFLLESDPLKIMNKVMFRALSVLDRTGCSKLIKLYTCSLFVPSSNEKFGAIPPCRSSCNSIEKSCGRLLRFAAFFSPLSTGESDYLILPLLARYYPLILMMMTVHLLIQLLPTFLHFLPLLS